MSSPPTLHPSHSSASQTYDLRSRLRRYVDRLLRRGTRPVYHHSTGSLVLPASQTFPLPTPSGPRPRPGVPLPPAGSVRPPLRSSAVRPSPLPRPTTATSSRLPAPSSNVRSLPAQPNRPLPNVPSNRFTPASTTTASITTRSALQPQVPGQPIQLRRWGFSSRPTTSTPPSTQGPAPPPPPPPPAVLPPAPTQIPVRPRRVVPVPIVLAPFPPDALRSGLQAGPASDLVVPEPFNPFLSRPFPAGYSLNPFHGIYLTWPEDPIIDPDNPSLTFAVTTLFDRFAIRIPRHQLFTISSDLSVLSMPLRPFCHVVDVAQHADPHTGFIVFQSYLEPQIFMVAPVNCTNVVPETFGRSVSTIALARVKFVEPHRAESLIPRSALTHYH